MSISSATSWSQKDVQSPASRLSKASTSIGDALRRTPSKKHKYQSSSPLPTVDASLYEHNQGSNISNSSRPFPIAHRPSLQRQVSAPLDVRSIKVALNFSKEDRGPQSALEPPTTLTSFGTSYKKEMPLTLTRSVGAVASNGDNSHSASSGLSPPNVNLAPIPVSGGQNPKMLYQHIHDMASKRISTLDYLRKVHEGHLYWFNTVHFSRTDLARLPTFTPGRLSRRATNYLLLGLSIPAVLDNHPQPNLCQSSTTTKIAAAYEFLRSLNTLLSEFETFQQIHPTDGSSASSLSRARIPQMFKRAAHNTGKNRRSTSTSVAEIGLPMQSNPAGSSSQACSSDTHSHSSSFSTDTASISSSASTLVAPSPSTSLPSTSFPTSSPYDSLANSNSILLPNEGPYTHLLTPPLPFAPDFYTVFATLCDVLIDAYQRMLQLVNSPSVCTASVGDMFAKADARLRKVIVGGVVREFESAAREGGRREVLGVQRVVLSGLVGG